MVGNTVRVSQNISYGYKSNDDEMQRSFVALNVTIFFCMGKNVFFVDLLWVERFLKGFSGGSFKVLQGCEMDTIFYVWYMKGLPLLKKCRCTKGKSLTSGCGLSV